MDKDTKVQVKFDTDGKLDVNLGKQLTDNLKFTTNTQFNTFELTDDIKFAAGLSWKF